MYLFIYLCARYNILYILMVIIAGYETELKDCFFNYNQGLDKAIGLESRFTWRFKTDKYYFRRLL